MRAALCGVLAIDERKVLFAVTFAMGEGDLDFLARKVNNGVEGLVCAHLGLQKI